jgi:hypothetical protein
MCNVGDFHRCFLHLIWIWYCSSTVCCRFVIHCNRKAYVYTSGHQEAAGLQVRTTEPRPPYDGPAMGCSLREWGYERPRQYDDTRTRITPDVHVTGGRLLEREGDP